MCKLFGDELFICILKGMVLILFVEMLVEFIVYVFGVIYNLFNVMIKFDFKMSICVFIIVMMDIGEIYFLFSLMCCLEKDVFGVIISMVCNYVDMLCDEMEVGCVDFVIGFLLDLKVGFFQCRLFKQCYVCFFCKGYLFVRNGMIMKSFLEVEYVLIVVEGMGYGMVDLMILWVGMLWCVSLCVLYFVVLGYILQLIDMIVVVFEVYVMCMFKLFDLVMVLCLVKILDIIINVLWYGCNYCELVN